MRAAALAILAAYVSGEAVELNAKNFEKKVHGKKSAFVKFLAPWYAPIARRPFRAVNSHPVPTATR